MWCGPMNPLFSWRTIGHFISKGWLYTTWKPWAKHPFKVMVWAGISKKGATNIFLLSCSVNSTVYQEGLHMHLLPFLCKRLPNGRFQQDNAPCHTSKATQRFYKTNKVKVLKTPPESPDLNPIRTLLHEMKHFILTTAKPGELLQGHTVILGHRDTEKVLQIYRSFDKGHAQSYTS